VRYDKDVRVSNKGYLDAYKKAIDTDRRIKDGYPLKVGNEMRLYKFQSDPNIPENFNPHVVLYAL
jgi:hypothetical protein